jgi:hypothetical protein
MHAAFALIALAGLAGCASTETRVRVVSRAGGLRDAAILPSEPDTPRLAIGPEVLTDEELTAVEGAIAIRLRASLHEWASSPPTTDAVLRAGRVEVVRARAAVQVGRDLHRHRASCRLRVRVDEAVVADAEGEALRTTPVRNVSGLELAARAAQPSAQAGRHPLIERDEVLAAVGDACDAALRAVTFDLRPEDARTRDPRGPAKSPSAAAPIRRADRLERRARALATLNGATEAKARVAALVALTEAGMVDDASLVARDLYAADARVRRSADAAFAVLCAGQPTLAPTAAAACVRPPPPSSSPAIAPVRPEARTEPPPRPVVGVDDDDERTDQEVAPATDAAPGAGAGGGTADPTSPAPSTRPEGSEGPEGPDGAEDPATPGGSRPPAPVPSQ